jgi:hypothetical protein
LLIYKKSRKSKVNNDIDGAVIILEQKEKCTKCFEEVAEIEKGFKE